MLACLILALILDRYAPPAGHMRPGDPDPQGLGVCDRCGAAALVVFERCDLAELRLCGHHADRHLDVLLRQGWGIVADLR
jgi:hypothetical protein